MLSACQAWAPQLQKASPRSRARGCSTLRSWASPQALLATDELLIPLLQKPPAESRPESALQTPTPSPAGAFAARRSWRWSTPGPTARAPGRMAAKGPAPRVSLSVWACCDNTRCSKWRRLPPGTVVDPNKPWCAAARAHPERCAPAAGPSPPGARSGAARRFCYQNPDASRNSCDAPEEARPPAGPAGRRAAALAFAALAAY